MVPDKTHNPHQLLNKHVEQGKHINDQVAETNMHNQSKTGLINTSTDLVASVDAVVKQVERCEQHVANDANKRCQTSSSTEQQQTRVRPQGASCLLGLLACVGPHQEPSSNDPPPCVIQ